MMSRKDFKAVAEIVRKRVLTTPNDDLTLYLMAEDLALYFKKANPTFDRGKFMRSAGYYQE